MADAYETRLWGGRFHEDEDALMQRFNGNACETLWLMEPDIEGGLAHVAMQVRAGCSRRGRARPLPRGWKVSGRLAQRRHYLRPGI